MAASRRRTDLKDYFNPVYGGAPGISASTKLFTKMKENSLHLDLNTRLDLPPSIDPLSAVKQNAESHGFCHTEENHVIYRGVSCTRR